VKDNLELGLKMRVDMDGWMDAVYLVPEHFFFSVFRHHPDNCTHHNEFMNLHCNDIIYVLIIPRLFN
jgi:hypothetical protein